MALEERQLLSLFTVTKTTDDGSDGTLRWAVGQANAASESSTIEFSPLFNTPQTITLTQGRTSGLELTNQSWSETIQGPMVKVRVSGNDGNVNNVLSVLTGVTASISNLEITDGYDPDFVAYGGAGLFIGFSATATVTNCDFSNNVAQNAGGSILNLGTAALTGCTISNSQSPHGGGIANGSGGKLTMTNCTISGNLAMDSVGPNAGGGGGLYNGNVADLTNCIIERNSAAEKGGGVFNVLAKTVNMTACTISGNGTASDGDGGGFYSEGTLNLQGCTISNNSANRGAGAFSVAEGEYIGGVLNLTDCTVSGNTSSASGGGLYSGGISVSLVNCTVSGNEARSGGGGGLLSSHGTATLTSSTFSGNTAGQYGGGLYNYYCTATITNCTVFKNSAGPGYYGGGLYNDGYSATLVFCTFSQNSATYGGGVYNYHTGTVNLQNNIVAGNTASNQGSDAGPDVYATVSSLGGNLIGVVDSGSDGWQSSDFTTGTRTNPLNPRLATLGNYGGPTQTMALLPGSPAIGNGVPVGKILTDQRGQGRSGRSDIGAFQSGGFILTPVAGSSPQSAVVGKEFAHPLIVTVKANNPVEPVDGGVVLFVAPAAGASATLSAATVIIANGQAGATAIANATRGAYTVTATAAGAASARFALANSEAPSLVVTDYQDVVDAFDGLTSLREAIAYANSHPGPDTITFTPADFFGKSLRTIRLLAGPLVLTDPATTTIHGPRARRLTIKGDGRSRVFDVQAGSAALSGLTIAGGRADHGGGLRNDGGTLVLSGVIIRNNSARGFGGGLFNTGRARLTNVIIGGNHARVGGGIANLGKLALARVTIGHNFSPVARGLFSRRAATLLPR
ncbi:right-handed parallel beta-helix repeat-containing protein [Singulisphaera sp. GP187]|uniref:right-handed parallel beta-helix repeat-containing protein n=1 Tax=Singulisphaera sp. GP187 TaxID=1882752 RepID=UPI0011614A23|nr:right-handed parallel beta-helix repeat-containing protein [Singulisphaera sp. GP187]